jgi:DNA-directed RNA polymerase II subunit RPB1
MPAGFNQLSSDLESIVGVQFSIFSPEEIERSSVVEITSHDTYQGNEPKIGGLFDPRMGVIEHNKTCVTHGNTVWVWHVFPVSVKCFIGEKVMSAALVR